MIPVAIDSVTADHVRALVQNGVREGRTIEYKQSLPGASDADKKEFLADVSSFANAAGGDLVYGIAAENGVPTEIKGLTSFDADKDVLRLDSVIRDGIQPRIPGLRTKVIEGLDEGPVLLVRVPKGWSGPHMVTLKGSSRFYARSSAGKFQMDVDELRSAFALASDLPARIRDWRNERVGRIVAGESPIQLPEGPTMILHLVPLDSFDNQYRVESSALAAHECRTGFAPMSVGGWDYRLNIDGFVTYGGNRGEESHRSYCQIFRSGRIEAACSDLGRFNDGTPAIASVWYEREILEATARYLRALAGLDVHPPIIAMLTFVGVTGIHLTVDARLDGGHAIDRDILLLPDVLIEEMPRNLPRVMRPMFDAVWNACGFLRSFNYDSAGNWKANGLSGVPQEVVA